MQYTQVRLLKYAPVLFLMLDDASAVQLMANVVHPSEASDVHDGIFSTFGGIYIAPSEAPDLHDRICRQLDGKCSTPK